MCFVIVLCVCIVVIHVLLLNISCSENNEKPYSFHPLSREFDVNENDYFTFQFQPRDYNSRFAHCYFTSESLQGDYEINGKTKKFVNTTFKYEPFLSTCGLTVQATDKTPLNWTITVYDSTSKTNYTEVVNGTFYYNARLYAKTMSVLIGGSGFSYFLFDGNVHVNSCMISMGNLSNAVMDFSFEETIALPGAEIILRNLRRNKCGVTVEVNGFFDEQQIITIVAKVGNKKYRNFIYLQVLPHDAESYNRTLHVSLGDSARIECGMKSAEVSNTYQKGCYLYNPKGELVSFDKTCYHLLDIVTEQNLGLWKCRIGFRFLMENLEFYTNVIEKGEENVEVFMHPDESKNNALIACRIVNFPYSTLDFCNFLRPDGKLFTVHKGAANADFRYTSVNTDLERGHCGIEIDYPFKEEDEGIWKCEAHAATFKTGGFLSIFNPWAKKLKDRIVLPKFQNINVALGDPFDVICFVPYSAKTCFIQAPNGTQYNPKDKYEAFVGECSLNIQYASSSDNGTWSCYFSRGPPHFVDEEIKVNVTILEATILKNKSVEVYQDDSINLYCNVKDILIEYCRFTSPDRRISHTFYDGKIEENSQKKQINVYKNFSSTNINNVTYEGRSLHKGDCGIKILHAIPKHNGEWTCQVKIGRSRHNLVLSQTINVLVKTKLNVWVITGIVLMVKFLLVVILYLFLRGRHLKTRIHEGLERLRAQRELGRQKKWQKILLKERETNMKVVVGRDALEKPYIEFPSNEGPSIEMRSMASSSTPAPTPISTIPSSPIPLEAILEIPTSSQLANVTIHQQAQPRLRQQPPKALPTKSQPPKQEPKAPLVLQVPKETEVQEKLKRWHSALL